ncbi:MAG: hypothetical protein CMK59_00940 [Proteobacteria bacterium]|nr:hypothetical protein [Pseudomonadota bacterium]
MSESCVKRKINKKEVVLFPPLIRKGDYIFGSFVKPEQVHGYINDSNPGNLSDPIGRFPFSLSNIKEATGYAKLVLKDWQKSTIEERISIVQKLKEQLEIHHKKLISLQIRELGLTSVESLLEIKETLHFLDQLIYEAPQRLKEEGYPDQGLRFHISPIGVLGMLTPFALSIQTSLLFSTAAILTGNTIVHKPSKYAPGIGQVLAELWDQTPLPRGVYNMVQGPGSHVGQYLIAQNQLDGLLFAGSHTTAHEIRKKIAPHLPLVFLLGGKSTVLVLDGANIDLTARSILLGAFRSTGQRPSNIGRVIVLKSAKEPLLRLLKEGAEQLNIGYGEYQSSFMGPLVSEHWRSRYLKYGEQLQSENHHPLLAAQHHSTNENSGDSKQHRGFYVKPAIYEINWRSSNPYLSSPPPGPILQIYEVDNCNEAIELHNRISHRRSSSIFCDPEHPNLNASLSSMVDQIKTGCLFLNQAPLEHALEVHPQGASSNGVALGAGLLEKLFYRKAILQPIGSSS